MDQTFVDKFSFKTILCCAHNLPFIKEERKVHTNEIVGLVCQPHCSSKLSYVLNVDGKILSLFSITKPFYFPKNRKHCTHNKKHRNVEHTVGRIWAQVLRQYPVVVSAVMCNASVCVLCVQNQGRNEVTRPSTCELCQKQLGFIITFDCGLVAGHHAFRKLPLMVIHNPQFKNLFEWLEREFIVKACWLFLQRTWIQFPAPYDSSSRGP